MQDSERAALELDEIAGLDVTDFTAPFETFTGADGKAFPWYLLRFHKNGELCSPQALSALLQDLAGGAFTDVFLFSHGWNNDWPAAEARYRTFIENMVRLRRDFPSPHGRPLRALLIGVIWPSTSWMLPWEKGPRIAASAGPVLGAATDLPSHLSPGAELGTLLGASSLDGGQARRLAELLAEDRPDEDRSSPDRSPADRSPEDRSPEDLLSAWRAVAAQEAAWAGGGERLFEEGGFVDEGDDGSGAAASDPAAAGLGKLDPRGALRALTVWKMKDRAGKVGRRGVAPVLERIRQACAAHIHLVGHSFGAKVVCDAVAAAALEPGSVRSMLLLQPAVSAWCFGSQLPGSQDLPSGKDGGPVVGGYRPVLGRVELPILTTFSRQDVPLRKIFHLALRRRRDLGEVSAASEVPRWAALGGYGPQGLSAEEMSEVEIPSPGEHLDLETRARVLALQGHERIGGHGDVVSDSTAWTLWSLVDFGRA